MVEEVLLDGEPVTVHARAHSVDTVRVEIIKRDGVISFLVIPTVNYYIIVLLLHYIQHHFPYGLEYISISYI